MSDQQESFWGALEALGLMPPEQFEEYLRSVAVERRSLWLEVSEKMAVLTMRDAVGGLLGLVLASVKGESVELVRLTVALVRKTADAIEASAPPSGERPS